MSTLNSTTSSFGSHFNTAIDTMVSLTKSLPWTSSVSDATYSVAEFTKTNQSIIGLLLIVFGCHLYYRQKFKYWSSRNVKTPTPLPFLGNFLTFVLKPRQQFELEWREKYGKIYGYYMGTRPYLVCADANVLKKICIKDFDKFPNHYFVGVRNKYQKHFLILQRDNHWRGMRAILTPTFSSGKMKIMYKIMEKCADDLVLAHKQALSLSVDDGEATVDTRVLFGSYSMGAALRSFYGINLRASENENSAPSDNTKEAFARRSRLAFTMSFSRFLLSSLLPVKVLKFFNITQIGEKPMDFFAEKAKQIIEHRRQLESTGKDRRRYNDYLQLLLEAKAEDDVAGDVADSDKHESHHALLLDGGASPDGGTRSTISSSSLHSSKMKLTETEVYCQTMMLMMVATETTATLLSHTIYLLAHHPKVQGTLYDELAKIRLRTNGDNNTQTSSDQFDYESLTSCLYLDCVISETLRLMSPALSMDREASEDYFIEEYGIHVAKGTVVNLAYYAIHRDPDYWPEPDKFKPERFLPESKMNIKPGSYCPFGIGPRSCVGFRFALTESKIAIAKLVTEFRFKRAPNTKYPPEPKKMTFILNENKNLLVKIKERN